MLKIRLMRIGTKQKPFYRVVVMEERSKRTGAYIELLGTYNPLTEPKDIKLKQDRIDHWIKQGAQPSIGFLRITGKAPQRPPRKPKKERQQATGGSGQIKTEDKSTEQNAEELKTEETTQTAPEEVKAEEPVKSEPTVIPTPSEASGQAPLGDSEESLTNVSSNQPASAGDSSATPQNDNNQESEKKDERPA